MAVGVGGSISANWFRSKGGAGNWGMFGAFVVLSIVVETLSAWATVLLIPKFQSRRTMNRVNNFYLVHESISAPEFHTRIFRPPQHGGRLFFVSAPPTSAHFLPTIQSPLSQCHVPP